MCVYVHMLIYAGAFAGHVTCVSCEVDSNVIIMAVTWGRMEAWRRDALVDVL